VHKVLYYTDVIYNVTRTHYMPYSQDYLISYTYMSVYMRYITGISDNSCSDKLPVSLLF